MKFNVANTSKEIPDNWKQITFRQYLDLYRIPVDDSVKILSVLIGIDEATLNKSKIVGLEKVLQSLSFMRSVPMDFSVPKTIKGHNIPDDLSWETTGQFKDCQQLADSLTPVDGLYSLEDQDKYIDFVAIYAMKDYCDASAEAQKVFREQFYEAPCEEVLAIGNFTLLKLTALKMNIKSDPLSRNGRLKKLRLGIKIWLLNLGFTIRYWRLRRTLE